MRAIIKNAMDLKTIALFLAMAIGSIGNTLGEEPKFAVSAQFSIPGDGKWDYLALDASGERLFITRSTRVQVVNPLTGAFLGEIAGTSGVHGVAFADELNLGFTSNGRANSVSAFDLRTLQLLGDIKLSGKRPDAILYVPEVKRLFVFDGGSNSVDVVDPVGRAVVGSIALKGRPEFPASDGRNIYLNLEDTAQLVTIDIASEKVTRQISLAPCEEPSGLAIDAKRGHLYSVCANGKMMVVEAASGRSLSDIAIGKDPDAVAFDSAHGLVFASSDQGVLSVVASKAANRYALLENVPTKIGARTLALDAQRQRIYLVADDKGKSGSFKLLVVTPAH